MSNLLKSKVLLGVMIVAVLFVGVFALATVNKASADCAITSTLKQGMKNDQVLCLQTKLGVTPATSYFGTITKAAVKAFQSAHSLTADGVVGPLTRAAILGTTPVSQGSCPAGYMAVTPVAPTFAACVVATPAQGSCPAGYVTVTPVAPTFATCAVGSVVSTGTNGYLTDIATDSTNRVSTVYESQTQQTVAGLRVTARLADQTINRVRVTFLNVDGTGSSTNLSKYITGASLWLGSTQIASMPIGQADRGTSNDLYTFNFSGLNSVVTKDTIGRLYVTVDAVGSIDSGNSAANWTVNFVSGGISASSPDGSYDTYPSADMTQTGLHFGKFSANGVKATVSLPSDNPAAATVAVSATSATNGVELLRFTVKATNSDLTLRKIPIQITKGTAAIGNIINTLYLYNGTNSMQSVDGGSSTLVAGSTYRYLFDSLSAPYNVIPAGTTAEFVVKADLKAENTGVYADAETLTAALTNVDLVTTSAFSIQDVNGDQLPTGVSYRVGSAIGNIMTLRAAGVNVTLTNVAATTSSNQSGQIVSLTWNIPVTVNSFGNDLYTGMTATRGATVATPAAFAYVIENSSNVVTALGTASAALSTTDATVQGSGYLLNSGQDKHFNLQVTLTSNSQALAAGYYHVRLAQIGTYADSTIGAVTAQDLVPVNNFRTQNGNLQN